MKRIACGLLLAALLPAQAQTVTFNGRMGDRALLVIDGQAHVMVAGQSLQGVKVLAVTPDEARVEVGGRSVSLRQGTPVNLGGGGGGGGGGNEIVLTASGGGHFRPVGSINQRPVQFMVDTGATYVTMSVAEADRLGVDYRTGRQSRMRTANGVVSTYLTLLTSVRVGDVELHDVQASIADSPMDGVLLGNSFLKRFDMNRTGDTLRLTRQY